MLLLQTNDVVRRFGADVLFHNMNLQIQEHGRTALVGRNGAGKTTLLKMIAGITEPDEGTISKARDLTIGYLAQDQGLDSQNSIWAELDTVFIPLHKMEAQIHDLEEQLATLDSESDHYQQILSTYDNLQTAFKKQGGFEYASRMRGILHGFGFDEDSYDTPINSLSGGQKTKLALAKILLQAPGLLILDEPTNHLDIDSREVLENAINEFDGTVLFISHDRYFINQVATDILAMHKDGIKHYEGNYDDYLAALAKAAPATATASTVKQAPTGKKSYQQSKEQQRARRKIQRQVDDLEKQMSALEEQQATIQEQMSQPDVATDISKLTDLQKQLDESKERSDEIELAWTEAAEKLEEFDQENQ
jgi:ATPase subunit of ABC transporter with duplicated ATPase domains